MVYTAHQMLSKMKIQELLQNVIDELNNDIVTKQRKRYLEQYKEDLERYISHHPETTHIPSSLELYCDLHPEAPECLKYEI